VQPAAAEPLREAPEPRKDAQARQQDGGDEDGKLAEELAAWDAVNALREKEAKERSERPAGAIPASSSKITAAIALKALTEPAEVAALLPRIKRFDWRHSSAAARCWVWRSAWRAARGGSED
jgi:hypothetical protein